MRSKFFILFSTVLLLIVAAVFGVSQKAFAASQDAPPKPATRTPTRTATKLPPTPTPTLTPTPTNGIASPTPAPSDFSGSPLSGVAPLTVQFTTRYAISVHYCTWDFGDGTTQYFYGASGSLCPSVSHTYNAAGSYTVSLTYGLLSGTNMVTTKANYIQVTGGSGGSTPTLTRTPTKTPTVSGT